MKKSGTIARVLGIAAISALLGYSCINRNHSSESNSKQRHNVSVQCDINKDGIEDIVVNDDINNKHYVKLSGPNGTYETCKIYEMLPGINWIYSKNDKGYYDLDTKKFKSAEDPETQKPIPLY
jgi:hypothetical protein